MTNSSNKSAFLAEVGNNCRMIAITETWLSDKIFDAEITANFPAYSLIRSDRKTVVTAGSGIDGELSKGGGVCLLSHPGLPVKTLDTFSNGVCELLVAEVIESQMIIAVVYRPPCASYKKFEEAMARLNDSFANLVPLPNIYLAGDFNFPPRLLNFVQVEESMAPVVTSGRDLDGRTKEERDSAQLLVDFAQKFFLTQVVDKPTRGKHILDLLWTNNPEEIAPVQVCDIPGFSDHRLVKTSVQVDNGTNAIIRSSNKDDSPEISRFDIYSGDMERIKEELRCVDWNCKFRAATRVSDMKDIFIHETVQALNRADVPLKEKIGEKERKQIPYTRRQLYRKKCKLQKRLNKARLTQSSSANIDKIEEKVRLLDIEIKEMITAEEMITERKAAEKINSNPKVFYTFANRKRKNRTAIGPLLRDMGHGDSYLVTNPKDMSELLSEQYASVFSYTSREQIDNPKEFFSEKEGDLLSDIDFTNEDIMEAMRSFSSYASPGPDGFPSLLLKKCAGELVSPLGLMFRRCLDDGQTLEEPYTANVTPIFKRGDKGKPANYRPVSLTSHVVKTFEKVVKKHIVEFLESRNLYNPSQHGFRTGRSTMTQLISYYEELLRGLEEGKNIDAVYLDFSKAFDKCCHQVLLERVRQHRISGKIGVFLHGFLTNRKQTVVVDGMKSKPVSVESGVPQGSCLGPVLFLLMVSSIGVDVKSAEMASFADDTRLFRAVSNIEDATSLQNDLENVYKWAEASEMELNPDKFELMRFGENNELKEATMYTTPSGGEIERKTVLRDLGISFTEEATFDFHIESVVLKGRKMASWVLRVFKSRDPQVMKILLKQMVISNMEYCCPLWSPTERAKIEKIESVQRFFTRHISGMNGPNRPCYSDRLKKLKIYSLERRRERYMILFLFKVLCNLVPNPGFSWDYNNRTGYRMYISKNNWRAPSRVRKLVKNSPCSKAAVIYNKLPVYLRLKSDDNVDTFKRKLDQLLTAIPDEPDVMRRAAKSNSLEHQLDYRI